MKRRLILILPLATVGFVLAVSLLLNTIPVWASGLNDISDLSRTTLRFGNSNGSSEEKAQYRESTQIRQALRAAPISDRERVLARISRQTKWGTPERAVAYYISAWYGVNYQQCRDYLMNVTFWDYRFSVDQEKSRQSPFAWDNGVGGVDLMFQLYKHNQDFKLLHDILLENGDAGMHEILDTLKFEAFQKHPRGVIHAAALSDEGRMSVTQMIIDPYNLIWNGGALPNDDAIPTGHDKEQFLSYCRKVANDPNDPLRNTAKRLLSDTSGRTIIPPMANVLGIRLGQDTEAAIEKRFGHGARGWDPYESGPKWRIGDTGWTVFLFSETVGHRLVVVDLVMQIEDISKHGFPKAPASIVKHGFLADIPLSANPETIIRIFKSKGFHVIRRGNSVWINTIGYIGYNKEPVFTRWSINLEFEKDKLIRLSADCSQ